MTWAEDRAKVDEEVVALRNEVIVLEQQVLGYKRKLSEAVGEAASCPCNSPADHAGWCPRREY